MKSNELRIGNLYNHNGEIREVIPVTIEEVWNSERIWVKPIPLTEELLLECEQIEKKADGLFVFKLPFDYEVRIVEGKKGYTFWVQNTLLCAHIDYLHQLQNLYFALKQEELIFNLK